MHKSTNILTRMQTARAAWLQLGERNLSLGSQLCKEKFKLSQSTLARGRDLYLEISWCQQRPHKVKQKPSPINDL